MLPVALRNRELRKLLLAQLPADFSDWLDFVIIGAILAYTWNSPNYVFAFLAVSMGAPYVLLGPISGALVDRWRVREVLIFSNLARGVVTAAFFLAASWPTLMVLIAVRSSIDTFFTPAKQTAIQALTDRRERASANGLSHAINQSSKIIAPGAGGAFLIWFEPPTVFLVNAVVSVLAAVLAVRLLPIQQDRGQDLNVKTSFVRSMLSGLNEVRTNRVVRSVLVLMAASYFAMFMYDTFIAPLTRELRFDPEHLGLALAAVGAGGVFGSLLFGILPDLRNPSYWIAVGMIISATSLIFLGVSEWAGTDPDLLLVVAIFGILGFATALAVVPFRTILQNNVPDARMGRVTALSEAANTIALLSAPFIGALLAEAYSVGTPFVCGGVLMLLLAISAIRLKIEKHKEFST